MAIIEIEHVWKQFRRQTLRPQTLKEALVSRFARKAGAQDEPSTFWALRDLSLEIERGETFGIIGNNGSGKSTLLKLITGISKPTRGRVSVNGRVSALLELGAGFHPDFSGRENAYLNGAILGLSRKEVDRHFESIVSFAELEAFIDNPVKTYSSGMYMRLAFSIAIHVDPDILVIDEVLAVGDTAFQQKCFDQIHKFKHHGKTILFVSHSLQTVQDLCQRAAWIDRGDLRALGKTGEVLDFYSEQIAGSVEKNRQALPSFMPDGRATIRNIASFDDRGEKTSILRGQGEARFEFDLVSSLPCSELEVFMRIVRADGLCCYDQRMPLAGGAGLATGGLSLIVPELRLNTGSYYLQLNLVTRDGGASLDEKYYNFAVESPFRGAGVASLGAHLQHRSSSELLSAEG